MIGKLTTMIAFFEWACGAMREYRFQFLVGFSNNGFTVLLVALAPVWLVAILWVDRAVGQDWLTAAMFLLLFTAVVASIIVATRDDAREGTGRWYGKEGVFATRRWDAFFTHSKQKDGDH